MKEKEKCKKKIDRMLLTQLYVATTIFFVIQNGSNRSFSLVIMCRITMPPIRSVASQQRFSTGNMLNKKMLISEKVFFPIRYLIHLNQGNQRTIVKKRQNIKQKKDTERERESDINGMKYILSSFSIVSDFLLLTEISMLDSA